MAARSKWFKFYLQETCLPAFLYIGNPYALRAVFEPVQKRSLGFIDVSFVLLITAIPYFLELD